MPSIRFVSLVTLLFVQAPFPATFPPMSETLVINEIYLSLQGESTFAGLPCIFLRLTACDLRCSYCDTAYAFTAGRKLTLPQIRQQIHELGRAFPAASAATDCP